MAKEKTAASAPAVSASAVRPDVQSILNRLPADSLVVPSDIAPLVNLSDRAFRFHCSKALPRYQGGKYRFMTDDADHMKDLARVLNRVRAVGRKPLP